MQNSEDVIAAKNAAENAIRQRFAPNMKPANETEKRKEAALELPDAQVREDVLNEKNHLFLTAGAGAGKSTTLVFKILRLIENGADIASIVAITFTRKAAAELKWKIEERLKRVQNEGALAPEVKARYKEALAGLDDAPIGTIHSFCGELLRKYGVYLAIDPGFTIADETSSEIIFREFFEEYVRTFWPLGERKEGESEGGISGVWAQIFKYDPAASPETIENHLRLFLEKSDLLEMSQNENERPEERFFLTAETQLHELTETLFQEHRQRFQLICQYYLYEEEASGGGQSLGAAIGVFLDLLSGAATWEEWRQRRLFLESSRAQGSAKFVSPETPFASGGKNPTAGLIRAYMKYLKDDDPKGLEKFRQEPWFRELFAGSVIEQAGPLGRANLVSEYRRYLWACAGSHFIRCYRDHKRTNGVMDYADLIHDALRLTALPEVLSMIQRDIDYLFVDEYQDTDPAQTAIFNLICATGQNPPPGFAPRLFRVGDEKQSIYLFRGADLDTYNREKERFSTFAKKYGYLGSLSANMRSVPQILSFVNDIFDDSGDNHPLAIPGYRKMDAIRPKSDGAGVYLPRLAGDQGVPEAPEAHEARRTEALWTANEIRRLLQEGADQKSVPDIGILFYTLNHVKIWLDVFIGSAIPVRVIGRKYFGENEMRRYLTHLLKMIRRPDDLQSAAGFLRSPFGGFTDAEVDRLFRFGHDERPFVSILEWSDPPEWQAIVEKGNLSDDLAKRAAGVSALVRQLHSQTKSGPISHAVWRMIERFELLALDTEGLSNSGMFSESVFSAYESAVRLDMQAGTNEDKLDLLIDTVERYENVTTQIRTEEAPGAGENRVQIMSYHKSKGLEFDVVFLADLAYGFQAGGLPLFIESVEHNVLGDPVWNLYSKDDISHFQWEGQNPGKVREQKFDDEKVRLLYVAMTRARERLYLPVIKPSRTMSSSFLMRLAEALRIVYGLDLFDFPEAHAKEKAGEFCAVETLAGRGEAVLPKPALSGVYTGLFQVASASPGSFETKKPQSNPSAKVSKTSPPMPEYRFFSGTSILKKMKQETLKSSEEIFTESFGEAPVIPDRDLSGANEFNALPAWKNLDALELGTIAHLIFEWTDLRRPEWNEAMTQGALFARKLPNDLRPNLHGYANRILETYRASKLFELVERSAITGKEVSFSVEAGRSNLSPENRELDAKPLGVGYIDLLLYENGVYHVIDYKTNALQGELGDGDNGNAAPPDAALQKLLSDYEIPMKIYYIAIKETFSHQVEDNDEGGVKVKLALYHVPSGQLVYYPDPEKLPGPESWGDLI